MHKKLIIILITIITIIYIVLGAFLFFNIQIMETPEIIIKVEVIELKGLDESDNFFTQAARAFKHKRAKIAAVNFDLKAFDLICLGTPIWAFGPAPAINAYLDGCFGITGKEMVLFTTYGSGTGNKRCLNYMQNILVKKGANNFKRFSIQQGKINDRECVLSKIRENIC